MKKYLISKIILFFFIVIGICACNKDADITEINLAYKMLGDKIWYLEYTQNTVGSNINTNTFVGQSTYFINFLKDLTTKDSDGLTGAYSVVKNGDYLRIIVSAKSINGSNSNYSYNVVSLGENKMVLMYNTNSSSIKYYYSTRK